VRHAAEYLVNMRAALPQGAETYDRMEWAIKLLGYREIALLQIATSAARHQLKSLATRSPLLAKRRRRLGPPG